ncbi:MAG: glycoside hydrolase family 20 zincin-like fold domain-containing protein [Sphaerochaetaceae bacterium]|nr:glycoside hydrolase family 20 zincin-like fold domain-containing protein [Sphaerochaetaceae bacterium]
MKKKVQNCLLICFMAVVFMCVSCASAPSYTTTVAIKGADCPQAQFAAGDIATALEKVSAGVVNENAEWVIRFAEIDPSLGEQSYRIEVLGKVIEITGGDERGLMYGGLDLSEQIIIAGGVQGIKSSSVTPYIKERGFKYHTPLDLRCPCYPSIGDSGINNIENVWDMNFWLELFDTMARDRFNTLYITSVNPFASLVKVEDYPDCAIDDVWVPTIKYDNTFKGSLEDAVREEHWQEGNYKVVKKMTIDEKIAFWQKIMELGQDRGIDFYFRINHIHVFAEHGKYGITDDIDNPITKDYYMKSATALLNTYPLLKGIDINDGENMGWDNSAEGEKVRLQWLHDVYVPAINAVLEADPDRELWLGGAINGNGDSPYVEDLNERCRLTHSAPFTSTHMYATSTPQQKGYADNYPFEDIVISFRNEDSFDLRFGDYDFFKDFIGCMPAEKMKGYMTGSDGYCYQRDYSSLDPELQGELYLEKHWLNYVMIGHMTYNYNLDREYFEALLEDRTNHMADTDLLFETTSLAGKVFPTISKQYFSGNSDYTWHVSGSWSHPSTNGYIDIKKFMRSTNVYPNGGCVPIETYCLALKNGDAIDPELVTPIQTAEKLTQIGTEVLDNVAKIRSEVKQGKKMSYGEKYFWNLLSDDEAIAYLSLFYAEKILGAVDLRMYNEMEDSSYQDSAVAHLESSYQYWLKYAEIVRANYVVQHLARLGDFDVAEIAKEVEADIKVAKTWKIRPLPATYVVPAKGDFFNSGVTQ